MKKRNIEKLQLKKAAISNLNADKSVGGTGDTQFCLSYNFCETIDYSACNGEFICQIYTSPQR
ncbi:hypothetical protein U8527_18950 [Kordia algicida OT-1]|uniref:Uncharacterized protein n=1 Tax=Kordia algicida OT-1 TaxID=391587 RepID=A9DJD8_9FLAO|nr:hypothetical protein [Kordia algicida]EDP98081.1 hypothetical protein KAOT1_12727 [Kordia algicida OT-1]